MDGLEQCERPTDPQQQRATCAGPLAMQTSGPIPWSAHPGVHGTDPT